MMERYDIIIFGASGFTGKVAVQEISKIISNKNVTWAVSGRNVTKLKEMLDELSKKTGQNLNDTPIVEADVKSDKSLSDMASKAKVVVNCVGPYRIYGEAVVKACIDNGAHHVDISGEPEYMETIQLNYHKAAEDKGVYVISGCGFDSVPADLGLVFFEDRFQGEVNSVETYLEVESPATEGAVLNYGTYETVVYSIEHKDEMRPLRQKLFPDPLPKLTPKLAARFAIHKGDVVNKWCLPFLGSDRPVMNRSQRYLYNHEHKRPVQVQAYVAFPSLLKALVLAFMAGIFALMAKCSCTRNLLLQHPRFFSAGLVSRDGPSEEAMKNTKFSITFVGKGWTEKKPLEESHTSPPNKTMITKVSGSDPGYGFTTTALLLSAITILKESDKMPGKGGVLTTSAFAKTSLISELEKHGLKFEVIKQEEIGKAEES